MHLGDWSAVRVALVAGAWPLLVLGFVAWRIVAWRIVRLASRENAAFVSVSLPELLLVLFGPSLILVVAWL